MVVVGVVVPHDWWDGSRGRWRHSSGEEVRRRSEEEEEGERYPLC